MRVPCSPALAALVLAAPLSAAVGGGESVAADPPRFAPAVQEFVEAFKPGGSRSVGQSAALPAGESLQRLRPAPGYAVELAASEPLVRQPIDLQFDERGRLWVVQYLQYPFPAGLTVTAYDQYLRAEFDRMPPPPPRHYRGADKITILEDRDGDGRYETHRHFVEGLNMATSVALGDGGVWVLQSPYLLFYPDRDGDDVPDGDPEVHLTGFGLEDTHSLASSLHLGPDGWLYGATGSTTNLEIQGLRLLGQGIWRYHPGTRVFEIFAEGGGNTFSFDFDRHGRAYSGTNYGGTRGAHYVQGATYVKGWTKHGPAMNPFVFGFFEHMGHAGYSPRFAQAFLFYEGGLMPGLQGQIVAGMALTNRVQASAVLPDTSTFRTIDRDLLLETDDQAFRPVDLETGPDGAIYLADWADVRIGHLNPHDTWDKSTGRIYRLVPAGFVRPANVDLRRAATAELLGHLGHANRWYREHARRLLAQRPEDLRPVLQRMLDEPGDAALEALWVLNLRGELDRAAWHRALGHPNAHVRRWAVRLLGDRGSVGAELHARLVALAKTELAVDVRSQLASSARRLPAGQAFPIVRSLLGREEDADDKHLPLLLWWAIESKADAGREEIMALVREGAVWNTRIFAEHIAGRLGRRYTADQGPRRYYHLSQGVYSGWRIARSDEHLHWNLQMCARLLATAPGADDVDRLVAGMADGLTGARVVVVPQSMQNIMARLWRARPHTAALVALAARLGHPEAMPVALAMVRGGQLNGPDQERLLELFAATGPPDALPLVAGLLRQERNDARRLTLLETLNGFDQPAAAEVLFEIYPKIGPRLQSVVQRMLSARPSWALAMAQRMQDGRFDPGVLSLANREVMRAHGNPRLDALLANRRATSAAASPEQVVAQLYETGRTVFNLNCAACHQDNGEGYPGLAPALVSSRWVRQGEAPLAHIILHGKENAGRRSIMPPLKHLDDGQIAAAITYVRREFGNQPGMMTPAQVAEIRAATTERERSWSDEELARMPK